MRHGWKSLLLLIALFVPLAAADEEETELQALRTKIEETRLEAGRLAGEESGILSNLMKMDEELSLANRLLRGLETKRRKVEEQLGDLETEVVNAEGELRNRRSVLKERLRSLYMFGGYHEFELLLGSDSVVDLVSRFDRILRVAKRDDELYRLVEKERLRLESAHKELAVRDAELLSLENERERERMALSNRRQDRRDLLDRVRNKRESYEKLAAEMEDASRELEKIIAARSRQPGDEDFSGPSPFDEGGDRLPWPVRGKVIRQFGKTKHPEFGTIVASNGIDIAAPYGTDVHAVAAGRVEYISTLPGYGNCIILRHGGGYYTLYAHASEILVTQGERVAPGDVLARVGDTGSVAGSSLHFEVRKGTKPLDPTRWLR